LRQKEKGSVLDNLCCRLLFGLFSRLNQGQIILHENNARHSFGAPAEPDGLPVNVYVRHPRFYSHALLGGSIGAAQAYMLGYWAADDLTRVIRMVIQNQSLLKGMDRQWAFIAVSINSLFHWFNKNTRSGSKANILAHYDLSNEFYRLFLDDTLTYSCGIFKTAQSSLRQASIEKYDRICRKLQLTADDRVLEIGTGWGGFALHAARHYGCRVTTTTISDAQYRLSAERFRAAGLSDRITLLHQDYRDLQGTFDKLVSIEMIEAVGHQFLNSFFRCCSRRLKPDGQMALQAITISDKEFDRYKHEADFIKRYIFPGGCVFSVAALCNAVAQVTDMRLFHLEDITPHYAETLRRWRRNFFENIQSVRALGFDDRFIRMWEYYLCYCEAGFAERYIGNVQMVLTKPKCRRDPILPDM